MPRGDRWRMDTPCVDCPFNRSGPGLRLRKSLEPGRWTSILAGLRRGEYFCCHKTIHEDDDGEYQPSRTDLLCAGAIAYQERQGCVSQLQQVAERLEWLRKSRTT